ncbi:MAG: protease complex subunit PrcB family protein [Planctomycetota bacterium]|jgi:hypothetical protein
MMQPLALRFFLLAFLLGALLVGGCATGGQGPQPDDRDAAKLTYAGPEVQAVLQQRPNLHQLSVRVQVPSGGYELRLDETRRTGAVTAIYLTLEAPGPEEDVTGAEEEKHARVSLQPEESAVHVYIRQVQRNVEYVQEPPAELAQVLNRS